MRMIKVMTAIWFGVSSTQVVSAWAQTKTIVPLEQAARIYNTVETADRLYGFLKIGASEEDKIFIEKLQTKAAGQKLPLARAKGDLFYIQGVSQPLQALNLVKGEFSFQNRRVKLDWSKGFK